MTKQELIEQIMGEFEKMFGGQGRYLCMYDEKIKGSTSIHATTKYFLIQSLNKMAEASVEAVRLENKERLKGNPDNFNDAEMLVEYHNAGFNMAVSEQQEKINSYMK